MRKKYLDEYDYLGTFDLDLDDQLQKMDEFEQERFVKAKRHAGIYRTDTTRAGDQLTLNIYPAFAVWDQANRAPKTNRTKKAQAAVNAIRAKRNLELLCASNFTRGDLWCTFTFRDGEQPADDEEARRLWRNFVRRISNRRKALGLDPMKYIAVMEKSEKGRYHFHVIMSGDLDRDEVERIWKYGDRNNTRRLDPDDDTHLDGLANYIAKNPEGKKRWFSSKNLVRPIVTKSYTKFRKRKVERMAIDHADLVQSVLEAYPEYKFVDANVKINAVNGGFYIYVKMTKVNKRQEKPLYPTCRKMDDGGKGGGRCRQRRRNVRITAKKGKDSLSAKH